MNKNIGTWYRDAKVVSDGEVLNKRKDSISKYLETDYSKEDILQLVKLFMNIDELDDQFNDEFTEIFIEDDSAFCFDQIKELRLLAGIVINEIIKNNEFIDLIGLCCMRIKNYYDPIVPKIYTNIENKFFEKSKSIRESKNNNLFEFDIPVFNSLSEVNPQTAIDQSQNTINMNKNLIFLEECFEIIKKNESNLNRINKIKSEDSDILWWMVGEWSKDLNQAFSKIDSKFIAALIGKELADKVQILPGPYSAKAVIEKMVLQFTDNSKCTILECISSTEEQWIKEILENYFNLDIVIFTPGLNILKHKIEVGEEHCESFYKKLFSRDSKNDKKTLVDISYEIYLECLLSKAYNSSMEE